MLQPGELIAGDLEIIRRLGGGGMGSVYLARQRSTDALRAVKVMLPEWVHHEGLVQRFVQEARACGRIQSEHVIEVLGFGFDVARGCPWLVMEYLPGQPLDEWVAQRGPPDPRQVRALLEQLFHGVSAAHRARVVHRDLKPQNVYIAASQRPDTPFTLKILDFGIAKQLGGSRPQTQAMGTRAWMAPEQERHDFAITESADVWALGLLTFWLLTGTPFWRHASGSDSQLSYEIFFERIPPASQRALELGASRQVPAAMDPWFAACLDRTPEARFPNATTCWEALLTLLPPAPRQWAVAATATTLPASTSGSSAWPSHSDTVPSSEGVAAPRTTSRVLSLPASESPPGVTRSRRWVAMWPLLVVSLAGLFAALAARDWLEVLATRASSRLLGVWGEGLLGDAVEAPPAESPSTLPADLPALRDASAPVGSVLEPRVPPGMVLVTSGAFTMGLEGIPGLVPHRVTLTRPFFIDVTETTVRQYAECVQAGKCTPSELHGREMDDETRSRFERLCHVANDPDKQEHPVNCVDRHQAATYCAFRDKRLPTEAEWEYAARGSDGRVYPWGNEPPNHCDMAVLSGICEAKLAARPVASRSPSSASPWGALDMSGNIWEWVEDTWDERAYARGDVQDPVVKGAGAYGILRGGSWDFAPKRGTVAYRLRFRAREGNVSTGFRCVRFAD